MQQTLRTLALAAITAMVLSACLPPPHHDGPGRHSDDRSEHHDEHGDHGDRPPPPGDRP